jgi:histidinol phosphatase-like PHP family hydrolase
VKIVINTDSHHTSHLDKIRYGILQAARAWLNKDDVSAPTLWQPAILDLTMDQNA